MCRVTGKFCVWSIDRSNKQKNKHDYTNKQTKQTDLQSIQAISARYLSSHLDRIKRMADSHATNSTKSSSKEISHPRYTPSLLSVASWTYLNSARTYCSPLNISALHLPVLQTYLMTSHPGWFYPCVTLFGSSRNENRFECGHWSSLKVHLETNISILFGFLERVMLFQPWKRKSYVCVVGEYIYLILFFKSCHAL